MYSKKAGRLIIIYSLAAVLVMGQFLVSARRENSKLSRAVDTGYDHAFTELASAVGELDSTLKKAVCAASPCMVSSVCAQGYASCAAASQAISSLPYGNIELEHTAAFLAKAGDYMLFLSRSAARGEALSEEERQALETFSKGAEQVSAALSELSARLIAGDVSTRELEAAEETVEGAEESVSGTGFAASFKAMETETPEMPTLVYDGPFSAHIENASPRLLEGEADVDEDGAKKAAADFLGTQTERLELRAFREGNVPVYVFSCQHANEVRTVEVTRAGGKIFYFGTARESSEGDMTAEEAVRTAAAFLESHGYESMTPTYSDASAGELTASFAFEQDGVICYPDLIKVTVALDTGEVVGMEAKGYVMNHSRRELGAPLPDPEGAAGRLSPALTVKSHRPALIPTAGKNEVLCEEYTCQVGDGRHVMVYVNAETGMEEQILLLLESDSGTLAV